MQNKYQMIVIALLTVAVAAGVYLGFQYVSLKKQEVANSARYECALSSKFSIPDGKATVSYPVKDLYTQCLSEKGIN